MLFWKLTFFHNSAFTICTFDADSFMHGSFCWQSISTLYCYYFYALLPPPSIQVGMHIILSHAVIWPVFTLLTLQSSHTRSPTMSAGARHPAAVCVCVCVCVFTHSCSSHSRAGIHNTRWSSVSAPLWTRCWCPRLSGRTWGPPWWPRPPPGTWAVWAEGWCPKAFWGSRRATCASRCKKREQEEGGWGVWGLAALEDKVRPPG